MLCVTTVTRLEARSNVRVEVLEGIQLITICCLAVFGSIHDRDDILLKMSKWSELGASVTALHVNTTSFNMNRKILKGPLSAYSSLIVQT